MMKNETVVIAKNVIDLQIKALKKLKNVIDNNFNSAVNAIIPLLPTPQIIIFD